MPPTIFISYRRADTPDVARAIAAAARARFGSHAVFMDIDSIRLGDDFVEVVNSALDACSVLLAIIGPTWIAASTSDGALRLNDPADFVRMEISTALEREIPVVPVLVAGAAIPAAGVLPEDLRPLIRRQAAILMDATLAVDIDRLLNRVAIDKDTTEGQAATPIRRKLEWKPRLGSVYRVLLEDETKLAGSFDTPDGDSITNPLTTIQQERKYLVTFEMVQSDGSFTLTFVPVSLEHTMIVGRARLRLVARRSASGDIDITIVRPPNSDETPLPDDDSERRIAHSALDSKIFLEVAPDGTVVTAGTQPLPSTREHPPSVLNPILDSLTWLSNGIDVGAFLASHLLPVLPTRAVAEGADWRAVRKFDVFGVQITGESSVRLLGWVESAAGTLARIREEVRYSCTVAELERGLALAVAGSTGAKVDVHAEATESYATLDAVFDVTRGIPRSVSMRGPRLRIGATVRDRSSERSITLDFASDVSTARAIWDEAADGVG